MNIESFLRGKAFLILFAAGFLAIFSIITLIPSLAQSKGERAIEDKIPKHVPIKVKIKSEKEKLFRDLNNRKWVRDLELEIANTSDKPIYFLELWVVLPEVRTGNGMELGFPLRYGRSDFIKFKTLALPEDIAIQPGEQYVFQIPDNYLRGWEAHWPKQHKAEPSRVQIKFVQLSFGDGTGFNGTDAKPYPYKKNQTSAACREGPTQLTTALHPTNRSSAFSLIRDSFFLTPVEFLPVKFFMAKSTDRIMDSATQSGLCCPGTSCFYHKNSTYQCICKSDARDN